MRTFSSWAIILVLLPLSGVVGQDTDAASREVIEELDGLAVVGRPDPWLPSDPVQGGPAGCTPAPAGMVGWWTLDERAGSLHAHDRVGDHHGAIEGAPFHAPGMVAGAFTFDGNDRVRVPHAPTLHVGLSDLSFDAWIQVGGTGSHTIAEKMDRLLVEVAGPDLDELLPPRDRVPPVAGGHAVQAESPANSLPVATAQALVAAEWARGYHFLVKDGTLQFVMADGSPTRFDSGYLVADGARHLVAVTVDRTGTGLFYVDGVAVSAFNPMLRPGDLGSTADLLLGSSPGGALELDEVELFHRVLDEAEIQAIYEAGPAGKCKTECLLTVEHEFEAGDQDDFALPASPTSQRAALAAHMAGTPQRGFDQVGNDRQFGHSFENLPTDIVAGTLEVRMGPDTSSLARNDALALQFNGGGFEWGHRIGTDGVPGLLASNWFGAPPHTFVLDLANLPSAAGTTTDLLPSLEANGYLDVHVQDDTRIDYIVLRLTTCNCTPPPPGMAAWWPLDEAAGPVAHDVVGLHDGAHAGGVPVSGLVDGGLRLDGVDDHVSVPDHADLDMDASSLSIDAWILPDTLAGVRPVLDKLDVGPAGAHGYRFSVEAGMLAFSHSHASGVNTVYCTGCSGLLSAGAWSLVAVTFDRVTQQVAFYVDGAQVETRLTGAVPNGFGNGQDLLLGKATDPATHHFAGVLDEVELFGRVLDPAEVATLHRFGEKGKCKDCPTPVTAVATAGDDDGFETGDGPEPSSPEPGLHAWAPSTCFKYEPEFDSSKFNECFAHTFQGLPAGTYTAATLEIHARHTGCCPDTDGFGLQWNGGGSPSFLWSHGIDEYLGTTWHGGDHVFTFDLSALPRPDGTTVDLLPSLGDRRALDVWLSDDTAVDDIVLRYRVCAC